MVWLPLFTFSSTPRLHVTFTPVTPNSLPNQNHAFCLQTFESGSLAFKGQEKNNDGTYSEPGSVGSYLHSILSVRMSPATLQEQITPEFQALTTASVYFSLTLPVEGRRHDGSGWATRFSFFQDTGFWSIFCLERCWLYHLFSRNVAKHKPALKSF